MENGSAAAVAAVDGVKNYDKGPIWDENGGICVGGAPQGPQAP